jgi:hypothetical protein
MGWEQRRGRFYYYWKVRQGGRVRSVYFGGGIIANLCAELDCSGRLERHVKSADERAGRHAEAEIDRQLNQCEVTLVAQIHAALVTAGYHSHKGQWRKKRREKQATRKDPPATNPRNCETFRAFGEGHDRT